MSTGIGRELHEIAPDANIVAPAQMAAVFNHTAPLDSRMAAPLQTIETENNGRAANAEQVMKQAGHGIQELDKIFQSMADQAGPETCPGLATQVAAVGVKLIDTAVSAALTLPAGGGTMATMGMSGSLFRAARQASRKAEEQSSFREESGYDASAAAPSVHSYGSQPVSMPRTLGTPSDINAFRGGAARMAAVHGGPDLLADTEMTSYMLQEMETLKWSLEQQQELAGASMGHARIIGVTLDTRMEKGVATNADTIEHALEQDKPENIERGVTYGV